MAKALFAVDELCGFLVACALVRPSRSFGDLEVVVGEEEAQGQGLRPRREPRRRAGGSRGARRYRSTSTSPSCIAALRPVERTLGLGASADPGGVTASTAGRAPRRSSAGTSSRSPSSARRTPAHRRQLRSSTIPTVRRPSTRCSRSSRGAERWVHFENYIIRDDHTGRRFARRADRARARRRAGARPVRRARLVRHVPVLLERAAPGRRRRARLSSRRSRCAPSTCSCATIASWWWWTARGPCWAGCASATNGRGIRGAGGSRGATPCSRCAARPRSRSMRPSPMRGSRPGAPLPPEDACGDPAECGDCHRAGRRRRAVRRTDLPQHPAHRRGRAGAAVDHRRLSRAAGAAVCRADRRRAQRGGRAPARARRERPATVAQRHPGGLPRAAARGRAHLRVARGHGARQDAGRRPALGARRVEQPERLEPASATTSSMSLPTTTRPPRSSPRNSAATC